jgi:mono/diheme cytochrome c family protein
MSDWESCREKSRRSFGLAVFVVIVAGGAQAEEPGPSTGQALYGRYCATCHGATGKGDGPVAGALSPAPSDLTLIRADLPQLMRQIDGRQTIRAHGTAAMPVWGQVFEQAKEGEPHKGRAALLQVQILADYVRGLQSGARR